MPTTKSEIRIGRVVSVQVPRREARVTPESDVPGRFDGLTVARFRDLHGELHTWPVAAVRSAGRNVVLVLDGPSEDDMAALRKATLVIAEDERGALPDDEFFYDDVIGADVFDAAGERIGEVAGVSENPEYALFDVRGADGRAYMIACVAEHVLELDAAARRVVVDTRFLLDEDGHAY